MLTMGFKDDLDAILAETPKKKQSLLFSATLSKEIMRITKKIYGFSNRNICFKTKHNDLECQTPFL